MPFTDSDHGRLKAHDERVDDQLIAMNSRLDVTVSQIESVNREMVRTTNRIENTERDLRINTEATQRIEKGVESLQEDAGELILAWRNLRGFVATIKAIGLVIGYLGAVVIPISLGSLGWQALKAWLGIR